MELKTELQEKIKDLSGYKGKQLTLMEICGSHTAAIARHGIKQLLGEPIRLVSGPGCPVCVTPSSYIDKLIELSLQNDTCVVTFGDLLRVPGSKQTLNEARGNGGRVQMVYSPFDTIKLAQRQPEMNFVFAAVGFETTTPVYALLLEEMMKQKITNIKLLTALKTMPNAVNWLFSNHIQVDGFLAPGHVCTISGSNDYVPLAEQYQMPFVVAGFEPEELVLAIYQLVKMCNESTETKTGQELVKNCYPRAVTLEGNSIAKEKVAHFFQPASAVWRGMGEIPESGMVLKEEFKEFDAGSKELTEDQKYNKACCCDKILLGQMEPSQCPLFGKICNPQEPQGACMVSAEGSCSQEYLTWDGKERNR